MRKYLTRRALTILGLMWLMTVIIFALVYVSGGGLERLFNLNVASPFDIARTKSVVHIDQSPGQQYFTWLGQILQGNLGRAGGDRFGGFPVFQYLAPKLQASFLLVVTAFIIAILAGFFFGSFSALKPQSFWTRIIRGFVLVGVSIPDFAVGALLVILFAVQLKWLPSMGMEGLVFDPTFFEYLFDRIAHLILPALTLAFMYIATFTEQCHSSLLRVINEDYIRTARAKGLSEKVVIFKHALRNGAIPVLAMIFASLSSFLGGMVVVEYLFSWPGIGLYIFKNLHYRVGSKGDFYVVLLVVGASAILSLLATLLADFVYALVDPRVKSPVHAPVGSIKPGKPLLMTVLFACGAVWVFHWKLYLFYQNRTLMIITGVIFFVALLVWGILQQKSFRKSQSSRQREAVPTGYRLQLFSNCKLRLQGVKASLKKLLKPTVVLGIVILGVLLISSFYPDMLGYKTVRDIPLDLSAMYSPPSLSHLFGTDALGLDRLMVSLVYTRSTLKIVLYITLLGMVGGTIIGVLTGFFRGLVDKLIMTIFDLISAIPSFFLVLLVMGVAGNSTTVIVFSTAIFGLIEFARVVRARVLVVSEFEYVMAARALGNSEFQVILKHLFGTLFPLISAQGLMLFGRNMLLLSSLGFLGVLPSPTWGTLVGGSIQTLRYWWLSLFPIGLILITVLAVNAIGKGVTKALDPFATNL